MQLKNDYEKEVFNGDQGLICELSPETGELRVDFAGHVVEYTPLELDNLILSYACTIHKSQGSEFPVVIIPVCFAHYIMLQRNLIYTAITRATDLCVLVGEHKALDIAVQNQKPIQRNTRLAERLSGWNQIDIDNGIGMQESHV
jgi:exodeoxyribonuclease V alpha subunit